MDFVRYMNFFFDWVWLWYEYFHWNWSIVWHMDWDVHMFFNWIWLFDVNWYFDDFFDWIWDMLDNCTQTNTTKSIVSPNRIEKWQINGANVKRKLSAYLVLDVAHAHYMVHVRFCALEHEHAFLLDMVQESFSH